MNSISQGRVVDAVAEMSLATELDTLTETSADCWAMPQQIAEYLGLQDQEHCAALIEQAEKDGLIEKRLGQQAWAPTASGWWLWQGRNEGSDNPTEMNGRGPRR
jgi:hypothetical protein